jgi:hypothetical protein
VVNAFAQVFVVSMAEVMVCWALVGGMVALGVGGSRWASITFAVVVASLLFGFYHFAHSAPFNTPRMVIFLSVIGLMTSVFFFVSRDVYATILFHNFLGAFGVVQALAAQQNLGAFEVLQVPLIATAIAALVVLVTVDALVIRGGAT